MSAWNGIDVEIGKHVLGHNNYRPGRSPLHVDTNSLLGQVPAGYPGDKTVVDFGQLIGAVFDSAGQRGLTARGRVQIRGKLRNGG